MNPTITYLLFIFFLTFTRADHKVWAKGDDKNVKHTGTLTIDDPFIILSTPDSNIDFKIRLNSKDLRIQGPHHYDYHSPYNEDHYQYSIFGLTAKNIFRNLLIYCIENKDHECRLLDYQNGLIYAQGISCRSGRIPNSTSKFLCRFISVGKTNIKTFAGGFTLPKPRMGAGNAKSILKKIDQQTK